MKKYIKAGLLLLLAATPAVLIFMLFSGEEAQLENDFDDNAYVIEDTGDYAEISYGDTNLEAEPINTPQVTTLRLGGMFIPLNITSEVHHFNMTNERYYIEIVETFNLTWTTESVIIMETHTGETIVFSIAEAETDYDESWQEELWRAIQENSKALLYEGDFDIIVTNSDFLLDFGDSSLSLVDLYTLIDADPELNRTGFFQNVLRAGEAPDGTLTFMSSGFTIQTMISMRETAEQIAPLTFENLYTALQEQSTLQLTSPETGWSNMLSFILWNGENNFVDMERGTANFNNEHFITALELLRQIPERPGAMFDWAEATQEEIQAYIYEMERLSELEVERFKSGEILLFPFIMTDPMQFHVLLTALEEVVAVGIPSTEGGNHVIFASEQVGINADSPHQDGAWSFIRQMLMRTPANSMSICIDRFEDHMERLMRPILQGGVEQPRSRQWTGPSGMILPEPVNVFAMTEVEAERVREIVENATVSAPMRTEFAIIIMEEVTTFMQENRTAEETAMAIQLRVQEFLNNR
ncbi:MAG: hypothetical protein FWC13_01545 [Oscillospiraceae bacterium]|nr:hypothetical protein [Oscillospiraceae bacterium]